MKHSNSTGPGTTDVSEDRIQRVYRDTRRDAEFYGGHVWKVEYSPAYSHADRWFTSLREANDYAAEQEGFRMALAGRQLPPAGFTADPTCGLCFPDAHDATQCATQTFSGPQRYSEDGSLGLTTVWSAADGIEVYIDQRPGARLDVGTATELHQLLGALLQEVGQA